MISVRNSEDRGRAEHGWLSSHHTFSFADYYDPAHMGFRALRVINDDVVQGGRGFGAHAHRDMEILSYVLEGRLAHQDSMGTGSVIVPGDVQRMSAGTGVTHSERNPTDDEPVHFLQIWIEPERRGLAPSYEQKTFTEADKRGKLRLVASRDGRDGSVTVHQDVALWAGVFGPGERASLPLAEGRYGWVHVAQGHVRVNGHDLGPGDALAFEQEREVVVEGPEDGAPGEVLVFDLA